MSPELPSKARLRWQCRRGMLELDILLMAFLDKGYEALSIENKKKFIELLSYQDQQLYDWLIVRESPHDMSIQDLITQILDTTWKE